MDMRRLEVLCKVVEFKSFTKAAKALSLSQPTVSEHLRSLEEILGERLIDRLGRGVLPTPAGKVFYQYARGIIRMRDEAVEALGQFKGKLSGRLVLGASTIPGTYILPKIVGAFKQDHPAIRITLKIAGSAKIVEGVLEGDIEAGLVGSRWNDRRLSLEEVFSDELVLAVYPEHPWAGKGNISPDEIAGDPFILREEGSGTRIVMMQILEQHGFDVTRLNVVAEMGSTEAVREGIKSRIGVSILSRKAVAEDFLHETLAKVTVTGLRFVRPIYMVQRKNRQKSPLCNAFLDYFLKEARGSAHGTQGP
jgi:DNA-binding transcriptional LysR family regulator